MLPCTSPGVGFLATGGHATECAQLREHRRTTLGSRPLFHSSHRLGTLGGKVGCLGAEAERPGPMGGDEAALGGGGRAARDHEMAWLAARGRRPASASTGYGGTRRIGPQCPAST